jgi:hypothetical protein
VPEDLTGKKVGNIVVEGPSEDEPGKWRVLCLVCDRKSVRAYSGLRSTIARNDKYACIRCSNRRQCKTERDAGVLALLLTGATYEAVGAEFKITRERVRQIAVRNGLPNRRPPYKKKSRKAKRARRQKAAG